MSWDLVYYMAIIFLEGVLLFFFFRKKVANANKAVEDHKKTIAEKDKLILEQMKTISENAKIISETRMIDIQTEGARLGLVTTHFLIQNQLNDENEKFKTAQNLFADKINELAQACENKEDGSFSRNEAIKILTNDVIHSFSTYAEKASFAYKNDDPNIIINMIKSEVIPFLEELSNSIECLNGNDVMRRCNTSTANLEISIASLGGTKRCLLELLPLLEKKDKKEILDKIYSIKDVTRKQALLPLGGL